MRRLAVALLTAGVVAFAAAAPAVAASAVAASSGARPGLTGAQRVQLRQIARDTWRFYGSDVDPATQLPMDNVGPGAIQGTYTSAANIGVYLWAVVAAHDLHLITTRTADTLAVAPSPRSPASSATTASCTSGMTLAPAPR